MPKIKLRYLKNLHWTPSSRVVTYVRYVDSKISELRVYCKMGFSEVLYGVQRSYLGKIHFCQYSTNKG